MHARLRSLSDQILPHGWLDVLRQVALFGLAYLAYSLVRGLVVGEANEAFAHSREIISLERTLHIFIEPSIQSWAQGSHLLMVLLSWMYINAQTSVTLAALVYLYLRHNKSFYFVRNMFMIAMAIALVGYAVFPTAPPRFMPEWGFVDTVSNLTSLHAAHQRAALPGMVNPYAAVPSMHVAFAVMIGWTLGRLARPRLVKVACFSYPLLVAFVIIATANHFIFDAILGLFTAGLSAYGASWLARARPAAWRFSGAAEGLPRERVA